MNENQTRRSSHRADTPVDAGVRSRSAVDASKSPRRRARMAQVENLVQRASLADASRASGGDKPPAAARLPEVSTEAVDLFTRWLNENGFKDLEDFQNLTRAADATRHRMAPEISQSSSPQTHSDIAAQAKKEGILPAVNPASSSGEPSVSRRANRSRKPRTSGQDLAPDTSLRSSAEGEALDSTPNAVLSPSTLPSPLPPAQPRSVSTQPAFAPQNLPTVTLNRTEVMKPQTASFTAPKRSRRSAKRRSQVSRPVNPPKPLAKTHTVPLLLTLGLLAFIALAAVVLVLWFQAHVTKSSPSHAQVQVLGAIGAQPVLTLSEPLALEESTTQTLIVGSGKKLEVNHTVALRVTVFSGLDGKLLSAGGDESVLVGKLTPEVFGTQLYTTVKNATEGSRFLLKQPVDAKGSSHMEIGVIDVIPTELSGTMLPLPPDAGIGVQLRDGLPEPVVSKDFAEDFRTDKLLEGKGATVSPGQSVLVKYREFSYSNPPVVLKDHLEEPVKLRLDQSVQQGVAKGLVDQRIGSRILVQVPSAQGSGNQATILIIDILAAWDNQPPAHKMTVS